MKKLSILTIVIIVLAVAFTALMASSLAIAGPADTEVWRDHYYFVATTLPADNMLNPTDAFGNGWNTPPYVHLQPNPLDSTLLVTQRVPGDGYLVLALGNDNISGNRKTLVVRIECDSGSVNQLEFFRANYGYATPPANSKGWLVADTSDTAGVYHVSYAFDPQPDWEWIIIKNNGSGQVRLPKIFWTSRCVLSPDPCPMVPSLTSWGLLSLIGLLAATAVWVILKRRAGLAT